MKRSKPPRAVVVSRPTELAQLLARHGTRDQARFFLETRGQRIETVEERHAGFQRAMTTVLNGIPREWRRARVDRGDLDRFLFEPEDIVCAVGQDGLVANTAKYLSSQAVVGLNPDPARYEGRLVPHPPEAVADLLGTVASGGGSFELRSMVQATLDDGQVLLALNEVYVGHKTHQSSRYRIQWSGAEELHSSSGVVVSTGTGATGWARSIHRNRVCTTTLPQPTDPTLVFFVREAWPSVATGAELTDGNIGRGEALEIVSRMNQDGVIFGDGIESDHLAFDWGRRVEIRLAETRLNLLRG